MTRSRNRYCLDRRRLFHYTEKKGGYRPRRRPGSAVSTMADRTYLSSRTRDILPSIVRSYIETGEPVASRALSRERQDQLSPASIRNVMADLCEEGYLAQPHTSAGRIPTQKAFQ